MVTCGTSSRLNPFKECNADGSVYSTNDQATSNVKWFAIEDDCRRVSTLMRARLGGFYRAEDGPALTPFLDLTREGADGQAVVCPLLRGSSPTRGVAPKQHRGPPRQPYLSTLTRARALMARPWSARCYG